MEEPVAVLEEVGGVVRVETVPGLGRGAVYAICRITGRGQPSTSGGFSLSFAPGSADLDRIH